MLYKKCLEKRKRKILLLKKLCRVNYKITNKELIEKLEISKTEFYRNFRELADNYREENRKESLFKNGT